MKRTMLALAAGLALLGSTGCLHNQVRSPHSACACGGQGSLLGGHLGGKVAQACYENRGWRHQAPELGPEGPPVGTTAYPYYTLRGPRDFLANDPPSIGR